MRIVSVLLSFLWVSAVAAQVGAPAGVIGQDDREIVDSIDAPWNAVGKVQAAGFSWMEKCTGTLIAPDLVVTAAHCLFDPRTREVVPAHKLNFLAGVRRDDWLAHATASCIKFLAEPVAPSVTTRETLRGDIALLVLDKPVGIAPVPLSAEDDPAEAARLTHAGYGRDRPYLLSVHANCRVLDRDGSLLATDCDTNFGQSGGPVFVEQDGKTELAAVMVAGIRQTASLAVAVGGWRKLVGEECLVKPAKGP